MIDALWPDTPIDDAGPRLHKAADFARRSLGDSSALVLAGDTVSLFPDADVVVDVEEFERSAKQAIAAMDRDPEGCQAVAAATDRGPASSFLTIRTRPGWKIHATGCGSFIKSCCGDPAAGANSPWPTRPTRKPTSPVPGSWLTKVIEEPHCASWNGWSGRYAANSASGPALRWRHCGPSCSHPTLPRGSVVRRVCSSAVTPSYAGSSG